MLQVFTISATHQKCGGLGVSGCGSLFFILMNVNVPKGVSGVLQVFTISAGHLGCGRVWGVDASWGLPIFDFS